MFIYTVFPVVVAGVSVWMDVREARIDNGWIIFSMCIGLLLKLYKGGIKEILFWGAGVMMPIVLLGIVFYFRMLGAGDIKLFCALGGLMGTSDIIWCIVFSFLIGAILSVAILIYYGIFSQRIHYFYRYIQEYFHTGHCRPYYKKGMALENIHFSVPVFLSTMLYMGGVY